MTNEGRRDKESCAGDHRKRTETPMLLLVVGLRELSTALAREAKRLKAGSVLLFRTWPRSGPGVLAIHP